ncbi:MAG: TetR/AcrR family transcriptional regulator [Rhizomicrobium sp.]
MPKISTLKRETRRRQILDAALRCFSRDGFHNTTTADIARESGVSQGTLYLYFATKDDMIVALADDRHEGEAFINAMAQSEQDPLAGLGLLLELHGRSLDDPKRADLRRVGIQGWAEALRNPTIHASIAEGTSLVSAEIVRLIERGQRTGLIKPGVAPGAVARALIALFRGLMLEATLDGPVDLPDVGPLIEDMIRGALFTDAANVSHPKNSAPSQEPHS